MHERLKRTRYISLIRCSNRQTEESLPEALALLDRWATEREMIKAVESVSGVGETCAVDSTAIHNHQAEGGEHD